MNFIELININPNFSSIFGLTVLIWNYLFCYKFSLNFKILNNEILNFILFNILFYLILSPILLLFLFLKIELILIKILIYFLFIFQLFYFFYNKRLNLKKFNYFNKFDYLIIFFLTLFTFSQVTDADSLDYHLGGVIEIIRNNGLILRNDEWYHFRLIGLGEMINFYGLIFYSKNFGQLFQVLAFSNIILIFKLVNKNLKLNYLILTSFPLFGSIILSAKQLLIVTNCYLLVFITLLFNFQLSKKIFFALIVLIIAPIGFKHSYIIYSVPIWIYLGFFSKNNINLFKYIKYSTLIFLLVPFIVFFKNFFYYGDPVSPFLEFLKENPDIDILNFAKELRYSTKIFNIWEFFIIPFKHFVPINLNEISLLLSPTILAFYFIYFCKKDKNLSILLITIYCLLFFSGKSQSRYYLDLYLLSALIFLFNFKLDRFKKSMIYVSLSMIPYSFLTIGIILYSITTLSYPSLNKKDFEKVMNLKANDYEIIMWINDKIKENEKVFYDESIRSKTYQKHNFVYYKKFPKSNIELKNIIEDNEIDKIVLSKDIFEQKIEANYKCDIINKKPFHRATRNPINIKKNIAIIYILDSRCLKW